MPVVVHTCPYDYVHLDVNVLTNKGEGEEYRKKGCVCKANDNTGTEGGRGEERNINVSHTGQQTSTPIFS